MKTKKMGHMWMLCKGSLAFLESKEEMYLRVFPTKKICSTYGKPYRGYKPVKIKIIPA